MGARLSPTTSADVPDVARFLATHLNQRVSADRWSRALSVPWDVAQPNHGFHLREPDGTVVGAYLAYYSEQRVGDRLERFCNLGAWCVLEGHRAQGTRLLTRLLAQEGLHFTDFSPSGNVVALNRRLKFVDLDTTTDLLANVPLPPRPGSARVSEAPEVLADALSADELALYRDHRGAPAAGHLLVSTPREHCYVVFRRDTRKHVRAFGSILHASNPELFRAEAGRVGSHLLARHGIAATLVERRVVGGPVRRARTLERARPKMFRSTSLAPEQVGYLYSELTCLAW
ncbi:hypothetical protein GCM10009641_43650 [Mycobacterium cookii]|uniref:N-acetyltransferase domain-containing protein n=1 Tax=Nocardioides furvisabuli TaxID=375542 RepID=A0ABN2XUD7_9ACTN|nr:hypothetical protein [Nocardioides furvisabuli]